MTDTKLGKIEAIAFVLTVMVNHIILNLPKSIIDNSNSGAVLNAIFISIITVRHSIFNMSIT